MAVATSTALLAGAAATGGAALLDSRNQRKSIKSMEDQKAASQAFIERNTKQARGDIFKLFDSAQDSRQQGLQAGFDLFRQSVPVQLNTFRQGNMAAQAQLARGLPQMNNAILGAPIDYSQFQPTMITGLSGLTMPEAPNFGTTNELGLG